LGEIAWHLTCFLVANAILIVFLIYLYDAGVWLYSGIVASRLGHVG
jgi:hypothetical protein